MMAEGSGWSIIGLSVDVSPEHFIEVLENNRGEVIGLSALLTTTMDSMKKTIVEIKTKSVTTEIMV